MRRAIAVAQLVSQSEDALVSYWLERYADGALAEAAASEPPEPAELKKDTRSADTPEPVAAAH